MIIRSHYMRPSAIRGGKGGCPGRRHSRIKAFGLARFLVVCAGKDIHNKDAVQRTCKTHARRFMSDGTLVQEDGLKSFEPQRLFPMFLACPQELIFGAWIAMILET